MSYEIKRAEWRSPENYARQLYAENVELREQLTNLKSLAKEIRHRAAVNVIRVDEGLNKPKEAVYLEDIQSLLEQVDEIN